MAHYQHHQIQKPQRINILAGQGTAAAGTPDAAPGNSRLHDKARQLIDANEFDKAFRLIGGSTVDDALKNMRGVCLMRMGNYDAALRLYRSLVLQSGVTWMRPDRPLAFKTNFATALLLAGHPAGCADVLAEINQESHPSVIRLRLALKRWKGELSVGQKILWYIGQEPAHKVTLDYAPGELETT